MLSRFKLSSITLAHISLTFVGLMWVLPFLYYQHAYPITTFYQEWGAAVLGICAMPLLITKRYWQQPEIPRIVILPIGMMMLLLVQYALGKLPSFDQTLLLTLYFLWAALLMLLAQRLRLELGLSTMATVLAVCLIVGAELNALAGILQHYRWHTFLDSVVTVKTSSAVYGNLAQPNHFANYLVMGFASIGLIYVRWSMRVWQLVLLVLPLLFVLALSGSRGTWLYLIFMASFAYVWQRRDRSYLPLLKFSLWLVLGLALMNFVVELPWLAGAGGKVTTFDSFAAKFGGSSIRLYLWKESLLIMSQFPLLGAGFGQFAWQHFVLLPELQNIAIAGLYNNAHNVVMQLAAETGLMGLLIFFGSLGFWFSQAWRGHNTLYHWWGYTVLAVLGIHALLEYPLWYAYFIGVAAIGLGMLESKGYVLELRNLGRASVSMILLLGALSSVQLYQGYKKLETSMTLRPLAASDVSYTGRLRDSLVSVYDYPLLRPFAELFMTGLIEPSADHLAEKLSMNERAMRFVPIAPVVYRQAWLLALSDRLPEAKNQLNQALWSYPADFPAAKAELTQFALKDPAHFSGLLEFATQKYEEYQRAVFAK